MFTIAYRIKYPLKNLIILYIIYFSAISFKLYKIGLLKKKKKKKKKKILR
jgi:hypothetical protein